MRPKFVKLSSQLSMPEKAHLLPFTPHNTHGMEELKQEFFFPHLFHLYFPPLGFSQEVR